MKLNINGNLIDINLSELNKAFEEKKETFDIQSDDLVVKSKTDFNSLLENTKKEVGNYHIEIGRKEILKGLGIETEGGIHKDTDKALESIKSYQNDLIKSKLDESGQEPNKKIQEFESDIQKLQNLLSEKDAKIQETQNAFSTYKKDQTIKSTYNSLIPENTILPKSDMALILSNKVKFDVDENNNIYGLGNDGNPIKDENLNILEPKAIINNFFNENPQYLKTASGGAGEGDSVNGGKITYSSFVQQQAKEGNSPASSEFKSQLEKLNNEGSIDLEK